jgi:UDP-hydrolysing UDP-N-acetyl-D-glucosamine 2-epimerase
LSGQKRRKVCVVLVDRANYGRLKPVMQSIAQSPCLQLQVIVSGTMVLDRFDYPARIVKEDGFPIHDEVFCELEGSTPATMAKSLGFGIVEFSGCFQRLKPEIVLLIGDRYEALAAAVAAAYMNLCTVHLQGGEVSGSIDESARHAISKFAHFHIPATKRSADYLLRMGERPDTILHVGCPSSDIARTLRMDLDPAVINRSGNGARIDVTQPFILSVFHPTTTEYGGERRQMEAVLEALDRVARPTLLLWPNIDAGSDRISKTIRVFRTSRQPSWLRTITNLTPENYLRVLAKTACAVGNSSSFVRDAGYFGTPVVLVGNRQDGRETDRNVVRAVPVASDIAEAMHTQLRHGPYRASTLYGDGYVAQNVADSLARLTPYVQKRLNYVFEERLAALAVN